MHDMLQARYGDIQAQHDALTSASNAVSEARDACSQAFQACAPVFVGAAGDAAMAAHQQHMQMFDQIHGDMGVTQQRAATAVEELAALDGRLAGGLGGGC